MTNDLVTDQRVNRIATTLYNNNYDVLLVGRKLRKAYAIDRSYKTKRFQLIFRKKAVFYAEFNIRLFFFLLFVKADIFLSNDTDTLPANFLASKIRRKKLVFDAHEMFPEVPEVIGRLRVKKIWVKFENMFFPKLKTCYTVCQSIADYYNDKYNINMQVVRNISVYKPLENIEKKIKKTDKKILLYQGAVNIGRGIEWVIDAMPYLEEAVFYIAGGGDILQQLLTYVSKKNLNDRVIFLGRIPFEDLNEYTISADLGVSLLENKGLNYYYSLPNRIFDFMHAQVPVLATDFPEIRKVLTEAGTGELIDCYEPQYLAGKIKETLQKWENKADKEKIFEKARAKFNWEEEEKKLLKIFKQLEEE